jgi:DNA helicase-2/ATP-dependent DNA helicase PcrA
METLLSGLDADQRRAVLHAGGPLLLVAGAGSGKTRVIVSRIVRLLREGVPPRRILGITFTNRAAEEMRERVAKALPGSGDLPWLGTFHAFGALLLRRFGRRIGISPGFLVYDAHDQLDAIRQILADLRLDEKKFPPARIAGVIERAKREGGSIESASIASGWLFAGKAEEIARAYDEALSAAGAVDFADLIRLPVKLFREAPDTLASVRSEIRHLLVDEFQDVDRGQAELARAVSTGADSFCAVGDEDQSIYGWRGGSAAPMLSFERDHPGAAVLHLRTNYRTRAPILAAAESVIRNNRARREKRAVASREGGEAPVLRAFGDADDEARSVAQEAAAEIRRGTRPKDVAVFYRVNAQSRAVEDALRERGIPYVLRGALSFYDRAPVRDAMAYLKWFLHPDDAVSLKRLLKRPRRGVGEATLSRARDEARLAGLPLSCVLSGIPALARLLALRERWLAAVCRQGPGEAFRTLLGEAGLLAFLDGEGLSEDREDVQELLRLADGSPGEGEGALREFLERVSLSSRDTGADPDGAVRLMTLHNAKGLEFDTVFLVGVEEGLLPHSRSDGSEAGIEEERRLFYVGLTRARERASLSFARRRMLFGAFRDALPSRFLAEIPDPLLRREPDVSRLSRLSSPAARRFPLPAAPKGEAGNASRGRRVLHPVFGEGIVEASEGEGAERKLLVRFPGAGLKKILVRAAPMEIL